MALSRPVVAGMSAVMAAVVCVALLSSFSDENEIDDAEAGQKTQLYDGGWEDDMEKQNAIALKTFLGSKDPSINSSVFTANSTIEQLKNESSIYAQEMAIVQDEMDKEVTEYKYQFSRASPYDDPEPGDDAAAGGEEAA